MHPSFSPPEFPLASPQAEPGPVVEVSSEFDDFPEPDYQAEWDRGKSELERRCKTANISFHHHEEEEGTPEHLEILIRNGREERAILIADLGDMHELLSQPFEKYVFLDPYDALCSYEDGLIEASIRSLLQTPAAGLYRRLTGRSVVPGRATDEELQVTVGDQEHGVGIKITIGPSSPLLATMTGRGSASRHRFPSMKIEGVAVSQTDQAVAVLERLANSLFFEVDLLVGVPLMLARERRGIRLTGRKSVVDSGNYVFPRFEYDPRPVALYWYARSAAGMPLLQYLAYYQCLEFYFPVYSQMDAQRRIRNVLKDPVFNPNRDTDIGRVLNAVKATSSRAFGDERSQLRATVHECVSNEALHDFLTAEPERSEFLSGKNQALGVKRLPTNSKDLDLRNDVSDRIYEIRCKIVHTKHSSTDNDEGELLLPFSKEADSLIHDIALVHFIASRVLIASSHPLTI